jgi:hypothetical protein
MELVMESFGGCYDVWVWGWVWDVDGLDYACRDRWDVDGVVVVISVLRAIYR